MAIPEFSDERITTLWQIRAQADTTPEWRPAVFVGYRPNPPADYLEKGVAAPPDDVQYEGIVFTDGSVALRWRTEYRSTSVWTSFADFYHVHGHPEYGTVIRWAVPR